MDNLIVNLDFSSEYILNDYVLNNVKYFLSKESIKQSIMDQLLSEGDYTEGNFIKAEISSGLTNSGNTEWIEFYIVKVTRKELSNGDFLTTVTVNL